VSPLVGGAGVLAIGLAIAVRERGVESHAWVPGHGPASDRLEDAGLPWHAYSLGRLSRGGISQLLALSSIGSRLLGARNPIVHVHGPLVYGLLSPLLAAIGARAVVQFHIDPTEDEVLWALGRPPAAVGTCSRHIASVIRAINERAGRNIPVHPMPNAIDLAPYANVDRAAARRRLGARLDRPLVLMLANLAEHKGQRTAVHAVRLLKDRGLLVDCWLAGEERAGVKEFTPRLEALIRELGVEDQVTLLGFRQDGPELLQAADLFLLPSTHEGLPLSVLEAQAAGTVVLGSTVPGIREVVTDGVTGFIIDHADYATYADRMHALLTAPALYQQIAEAARAYVRHEHAWSTYLERAWQVYETVSTDAR
jgi:glycosyltransferase involved in cell wall biosynthesis